MKVSTKDNAQVKEAGIEEITTEEEAAIEEGRRAYAKGNWKALDNVIYELENSPNRSRSKKP